jgi:hypothetical protein
MIRSDIRCDRNKKKSQQKGVGGNKTDLEIAK